jgi:tetratricopeptide (TPR) repeat protein
MPDSASMSANRAVFLSYAHEDAVAALRIADGLRSAGVEVWFDQEGGLEHGDEWDAKIRHQIKECVLFLPLISANTQARLEGYFRIEWELAAERAMGIAHGVPFILPVVIDDTREPEALVPERFHKVQWMRLPGGAVSPEARARFLKLWSQRTGALHHVAVKVDAGPNGTVLTGVGAAEGTKRSRLQVAVWAMGACGVVAVAVFVVAKLGKKTAPPATQTSVSASVPLSEARQLVAKAWTLLNKVDSARAELEAADDLCKRAAALDSTDAEVWAAWSQVCSWLIYHDLDDTPGRREAASANADRALQLAPDSFEARLAQACYLVRGRGNYGVSERATDAEALLRTLLQQRNAEPRALLALGILQRNLGKVTDARATFEELARNPAYAATAWNEIGWAAYTARDFRAAEVAADRSIAHQPYYGNLWLKFSLAKNWHGDLLRGKAILDQMPRAFLREDVGAMIAYDFHYVRRDPISMLHVLDDVPREWLRSWSAGPTAYYRGWVQKLAGKDELARIEWRAARLLVDQRLADRPNAPELLRIKGELLARMGDRVEAGQLLRLARELRKEQYPLVEAYDCLLLEQFDEALALIEKTVKDGPRLNDLTAASLRLRPDFDPLRAHPRFQALLARLEADPRFSPDAKEPAQKSVTP